MPSEERNMLRKTPLFVDRDNRKCATTASLPIHGYVFGIGLRYFSAQDCSRGLYQLLTLMRLVSQAFFEMRRLS
jgi:hypothetical protein